MRSFFLVVPSAFFSVHPVKTIRESVAVTRNGSKARLRNIVQELVLEISQKVDQSVLNTGVLDAARVNDNALTHTYHIRSETVPTFDFTHPYTVFPSNVS